MEYIPYVILAVVFVAIVWLWPRKTKAKVTTEIEEIIEEAVAANPVVKPTSTISPGRPRTAKRTPKKLAQEPQTSTVSRNDDSVIINPLYVPVILPVETPSSHRSDDDDRSSSYSDTSSNDTSSGSDSSGGGGD